MQVYFSSDRESFKALPEKVQPGDCVHIPSFESAAGNAKDLLSLAQRLFDAGAELISDRESLDTRTAYGAAFRDFCKYLNDLGKSESREKQRAGIEKAREAGKYRGRRPIAVNEELFDSVVALWRAGPISAREAMSRLDLKPNTFYRRIKEQEETKMKDYKEVEKAIRSELHEAAQQGRSDLQELKKQLRSDAKELKKAADEKLELHDVEKEMLKDRIRAEAEHHGEVKQMKKDIENEAKELKKLLENKD